jgi:subtilisin family serine protease
LRLRSLTATGLLATTIACRADETVAVPAHSMQGPNRAVAGAAITDRYIVVLRDSVEDVPRAATRLLKAANARVDRTFGKAIKGFSADMPEQLAVAIAASPLVAAVEPDRVVEAHELQTPAPWALDRIDQRTLPLSSSYSYESTGAGVNVYILDSGIRTTHQLFGGRASSVFSAFADGLAECNGHGTYVAGIVGSSTYGVAKGVSLKSVRVLDCNAVGTTSSIIAGLDWLLANRQAPAVANMSFGLPLSAALNQAVANVINAGVTVVASAGNNGADACQVSPASVAGVITVGGSTSMDAMASWSGRGTCVDLFAPGTNVVSTWNTGDAAFYVTSGSSAASPHAAGAAALYLGGNPTASPSAVSNALTSAATTGVLTGLDTGSPNRLLYTGSATSEPTPPPPPPPTDNPPKASFSVSCRKTACKFDGSKSADDKGIVSYAWSFGDGTTAQTTGPTTSHTYMVAATYTVALTVTDAAGQKASAVSSVRIKGR